MLLLEQAKILLTSILLLLEQARILLINPATTGIYHATTGTFQDTTDINPATTGTSHDTTDATTGSELANEDDSLDVHAITIDTPTTT